MTILFSDIPDRIVTSEINSDFIGNWTMGVDSFVIDAPNTFLIVDEIENQDTTIIGLFNLVYDSNKKVLKCDITADNLTSIDLRSEFGEFTLVTDIKNSCKIKIKVFNIGNY